MAPNVQLSTVPLMVSATGNSRLPGNQVRISSEDSCAESTRLNSRGLFGCSLSCTYHGVMATTLAASSMRVEKSAGTQFQAFERQSPNEVYYKSVDQMEA